MEHIAIEIPFNKEDFLKASKLRWELHWKKHKKRIYRMLISATTILGIGLIAKYDDGKNNPFIYIGGFLLLSSLFVLYLQFFSKNRYVKKIKLVAEKYEKLKMDCKLEFSDDLIKYSDKEKELNLKWTLFTYYTIYKNMLILVIENTPMNSYIIDKKDLKPQDYERIFDIVISKLEFKEIK